MPSQPRSSDSNVSYERAVTLQDLKEMAMTDLTPSPPFSHIRQANSTAVQDTIQVFEYDSMEAEMQAFKLRKEETNEGKGKLVVFKDDVPWTVQDRTQKAALAEKETRTAEPTRAKATNPHTRSKSDSAVPRAQPAQPAKAEEATQNETIHRPALLDQLLDLSRERAELLLRLGELNSKEEGILGRLAQASTTPRHDARIFNDENAPSRPRLVTSQIPTLVASPAVGPIYDPPPRYAATLRPTVQSPTLQAQKNLSLPRPKKGLVGMQVSKRMPLLDRTEKAMDPDKANEMRKMGKPDTTSKTDKTRSEHGGQGLDGWAILRTKKQGQAKSDDGQVHARTTSVQVPNNFGDEQTKAGVVQIAKTGTGTPRAKSTRGSRKVRTPKCTPRTPDWKMAKTVARKQWDC